MCTRSIDRFSREAEKRAKGLVCFVGFEVSVKG